MLNHWEDEDVKPTEKELANIRKEIMEDAPIFQSHWRDFDEEAKAELLRRTQIEI